MIHVLLLPFYLTVPVVFALHCVFHPLGLLLDRISK